MSLYAPFVGKERRDEAIRLMEYLWDSNKVGYL